LWEFGHDGFLSEDFNMSANILKLIEFCGIVHCEVKEEVSRCCVHCENVWEVSHLPLASSK
jgi:hypothetical protein